MPDSGLWIAVCLFARMVACKRLVAMNLTQNKYRDKEILNLAPLSGGVDMKNLAQLPTSGYKSRTGVYPKGQWITNPVYGSYHDENPCIVILSRIKAGDGRTIGFADGDILRL